MKTLTILSLSLGLVFITSCNKDEIRPQNDLEICFENIGSDKIKDFKFQGKNIGDIKGESTTKYYSFDEIKKSGNDIIEQASVKSQYGKIDFWMTASPGMGWSTLTSGKHTIELSLYYGCGVGFEMSLGD
jgi:hypothetical protein